MRVHRKIYYDFLTAGSHQRPGIEGVGSRQRPSNKGVGSRQRPGIKGVDPTTQKQREDYVNFIYRKIAKTVKA